MSGHEQRGLGARRNTVSARRIAIALSGAATTIVALAFAPAALAGQYEQAVCLNPSGTQAGSAGWSASTSGVSSNGAGALLTDDCGPAAPPAAYPETSMSALAIGGGTNPLNAEWTYTAPANTTIVGGQVLIDDADETSGAGGEGWLSVGQDIGIGQGVIVACVYPNGCIGGQPPYPPIVSGDGKITTFAIPDVVGATQMFLHATSCSPWHGCNGIGGVGLYSAAIELQNTTPPQASSLEGTLLEPDAHGTATLTFTAADAGGPGVAAVNVLIDGTSVYKTHVANGTPDACQPVATDPGTGLPIFDAPVPCAPSANISMQFATGALADGTHDLKILVTDAAGNIATVYDAPITTENNATPSSTTTEKPGATGATGRAGAVPHYSLALSSDSRKLASKKVIRRVFDHSALTLSGTVLGSTGVALADAPVMMTAIGPGGARSTVATSRSNGTGAFTITAPPGDTRTLQLIGRNGTVTLHERVTPTLSLSIDQRAPRTVRITGRVGIKQGAAHPQLELEILDRATWQLLGQTFKAGRDGTFTDTYTASPNAAHAHYHVRVVLLGTPEWTQATTKPQTVVL